MRSLAYPQPACPLTHSWSQENSVRPGPENGWPHLGAFHQELRAAACSYSSKISCRTTVQQSTSGFCETATLGNSQSALPRALLPGISMSAMQSSSAMRVKNLAEADEEDLKMQVISIQSDLILLNPLRSPPIRSSRVRSSPIRSGPILSHTPTLIHSHSSLPVESAHLHVPISPRPMPCPIFSALHLTASQHASCASGGVVYRM